MGRQHFLTLDALRGVAALAVLVFHRRWTIPGGPYTHLEHANLAVDLFFLLSGFVIAFAYEDKLQRGLGFWAFNRIRAIRLYPLLILSGVVSLISALVAGLSGEVASSALLTGLGLPAPSGLVSEPFYLNGPVWSLFFEIIANLIYALTVRRLTDRWLVAAVVGLGAAWVYMLATQGLSVGFAFEGFWWGMVRALFPFSVGIGLYRLHKRGIGRWVRLGFWPLAGVVLLSFAPPSFVGSTVYAALCIAGIYPLVIMAGANSEPSGRIAGIAALLGALSYPVYILHYPLYRIADVAFASLGAHKLFMVPVAGGLICVIAVLAHHLYDVPVRRFLTDAAKRPVVARA
ncbi:acyltransferase family protein [Phenylobacterium sp.]|uniref:acyltransferase family protein n=1 Tax=Phenylobacterium sp. TaxID=1871053 RepID=UPI002FCA81DA